MIPIVAAPYELQAVERMLAQLPSTLYRALDRDAITVRVLEPRESYRDVAREYGGIETKLTLGLYNPSDRIIILREPRLDVLVHENFHHVDWSLNPDNAYRSDVDDRVEKAYRHAKRMGKTISLYGSVNRREFLCEAARSALGFSEPRPTGRMSDQERLARIDPTLPALVRDMLAEMDALLGGDVSIGNVAYPWT
jgi:hypothetical protein